MIAAPMGLPGRIVVDGFLRMSQGQNALNDLNTKSGKITHADGWGGVYSGVSGHQVHRSTAACWADPRFDSLRDGTIYLLHARRASTGGKRLENVHPFESIVDGSRWFFCHNGTVREHLPVPTTLANTDPTDSEKLFLQLLPFIREGRVLSGLREILGGIRDFTSLNSLLLGPDELWSVCLHSKHPDYYTLTLTSTPDGPVVSSEPLPELGGEQKSVSNGTILRVGLGTGQIENHTFD